MTGFGGDDMRPTLVLYRPAEGVVRRTSLTGRRDCPTCGPAGQLGAGDLATPPWRTEAAR